MATTPFFLWATQGSSSAAVSDHDIGGLGAAEEAPATEAAQLSPELAVAVARPRLRRQSSSAPAKQQAAGNKKPPQRGLGVAELERLRCGGDPLRDLNAAVAAAAMGDAANVHGHPVIHHHLPVSAFEADTGARSYAPLLVRPAPPLPPPAPFCYVHSSSAGGQNVAPEQQYLRDRWGCMGGFAGAGTVGAGNQPQLLPLAPEHPSSQSNTIWGGPASSFSSSCLHTGHRGDLCSRTMRTTLAERGARGPTAPGPVAAAATTTTPDYSIYDLAAAMATARKEKGHGFLARERKNEATEKEVREIEFFPTSTNNPDESEFATTASLTAFSSSAVGGGRGVPLDLSLRL